MYEDALKDIIGGEASNLNIKPLKHNGRLEVKIKIPVVQFNQPMTFVFEVNECSN